MAGFDDLKVKDTVSSSDGAKLVAATPSKEEGEACEVPETTYTTHFGEKTLREIKEHLKKGEMALSHFGDDVLKLLDNAIGEAKFGGE